MNYKWHDTKQQWPYFRCYFGTCLEAHRNPTPPSTQKKTSVGITIIRVQIWTQILLKTNRIVSHSTELSRTFGVNINSRHSFCVLNLKEFTKLRITSLSHCTAWSIGCPFIVRLKSQFRSPNSCSLCWGYIMFALVSPGEGHYRNLHCNMRISLPSTSFSVHYSFSYSYQKLYNWQATRQAVYVNRILEARSRNHHCCVCLQPQLFQDVKRMCRIIFSFVPVRLYHIFTHYLINAMIFRGKKVCFDFVYNFV